MLPTWRPKLTRIPGGRLRYDDDGQPIVDVVTCGTCGRSWNDAIVSGVTPVPSGRCPFESRHTERLACGHSIPRNPPGHTGGTGYAVAIHGTTIPSTGKRIRAGGRLCYSCAGESELRDLQRTGEGSGYLTIDPWGRCKVTTWAGVTLGIVTSRIVARQGFRDMSGRRPERWHVTFRTPDGQTFRGTGPGPGMYLRLRKARSSR